MAMLNQHLIDPQICIRCNTCEETCPNDAITHDANNYVVKAQVCNGCMACVPPCPTGAIDNWRQVSEADAYSIDAQFAWDELPSQQPIAQQGAGVSVASVSHRLEHLSDSGSDVLRGASVPPWSAARAHVNLYKQEAPATAVVAGNYRLTDETADSDIHHIVLDFGTTFFPILEGQSIGVVPPGAAPNGKPYHARQYSLANPRDGERRGCNNVSLTVKRVMRDHDGNPTRGVCSNYLCDLRKGDRVAVIGPFGSTFLMPNHSGSHLLMICTGTGAAPMRAMTEYRRRHQCDGAAGQLMLFFGARTPQELPYFGPLTNLPKGFIDADLAFSRVPGRPKRYVQDALRERAADVGPWLADRNTHVYVCGLKGMEEGVLLALRDIAQCHGLDWQRVWADLRREGRLHLETY
ncbi:MULTISPECIES: benzoyl-CoA 2,3-epoxidase subunit BoxA [Burkholderiaceae]|uniref:benzoyl-CoA 2,3-epoxidase subunit BoxA n=1 Tax=Burkholderiaceae TaxID=119060 RepID=UPI0009597A1B|nr:MULTISPECIES: benzoyl-CoA 2,3-epoxidase subunit BoxA [Burkholderiaceae]MCG1040875.1 benzoyl-CoA 2,3-epoxidase subunit BoxA [Mycetohabitans sp. B7]SIT65212.1 benzoyl-CoA 2,3-dioxygenase component A [Burkholderia sp. b14]